MDFLIIIFGVLFIGKVDSIDNVILFSSNWTGESRDVDINLKLLFNGYSCGTITHSFIFLSPGLSLQSQIAEMSAESQRLSALNIRFQIGYSNNFLNFIFQPSPTVIQIQTMYPSDAQLIEVVIAIVNRLYDPNQPKTDILVIMSQKNDINNLNFNNYENIVTLINQQNWYNVKFLSYISADDTIYQMRLNPYYNIISLLSDDSSNRDLIQKAYLANLMVWRYRWIIANLLGELTLLQDSTQYGQGVMTNNVTIITFADQITGVSGRNVLTQDALKLVRTIDCNLQQPNSFDGVSGIFALSPLARSTFKYSIFQNPGSNLTKISYLTQNVDVDLNGFTPALKYTPFTMNVSNSLIATKAKVFRIGYIDYPPFSIRNSTNFTGFWIDILTDILKKNNISYTFVILTDTLTGARDQSNLSYGHMMGMVQNGIVDTVSVPFIITSDRQNYFDLSSSVLSGYISVLYKLNKYQGISALSLYILPFDYNVWGIILGSALAVAVALAFSDYMFPDKYARYKILMSIFFSFSSLTHGAYFDPPRKIGGRIIMSFWWLFSLVVVIIWVCNYCALLYLKNNAVTLINFFDLLKQNNYQYTTLNNNLLFNLLRLNNNSNAQSMLKIMQEDIANGTVNGFAGALDLVINGNGRFNYSFIYEDKVVKYLTNAYCLNQFGNWLSYEYGYLLPKYSEKTQFINSEVIIRRANGIIDSLQKQYWPLSNDSCKSTDFIDKITEFLQTNLPNNFDGSLDIKFMIGVFVIVLLGAVGTLLLALVERLIRYLVQRQVERRDMYNYDATVEQLTRF